MSDDEVELSDFKNKSADKHRLIFDMLGEYQKKTNQSRGQNLCSRKNNKKGEITMNNINWKVRLQSGSWWLGVISAIVIAVFQILKLCNVELPVTADDIIYAATLVLAVFTAIGVTSDPTTKGLADSEQAMTYESPKDDSETAV